MVGKAWDFHVDVALGCSREENLAMIGESVEHVVARRREALFDPGNLPRETGHDECRGLARTRVSCAGARGRGAGFTGDVGKAAMQPFSGDLFKGMLSFFLLDMGLMTARNLPQLRGQSPWMVGYALIAPVCHATLALLLCRLLRLAGRRAHAGGHACGL